MKNRLTRWMVKNILFPWVLKRKGEVLGLIRKQESYRNHIAMSLYNTKMGWMSINRALLGMGLKSVKAYYMTNKGPCFFFELPDEERRQTLPAKLVTVLQPNEG